MFSIDTCTSEHIWGSILLSFIFLCAFQQLTPRCNLKTLCGEYLQVSTLSQGLKSALKLMQLCEHATKHWRILSHADYILLRKIINKSLSVTSFSNNGNDQYPCIISIDGIQLVTKPNLCIWLSHPKREKALQADFFRNLIQLLLSTLYLMRHNLLN